VAQQPAQLHACALPSFRQQPPAHSKQRQHAGSTACAQACRPTGHPCLHTSTTSASSLLQQPLHVVTTPPPSTLPATGEEVINSYGELSNSELLRGYGFVEKDNPHGAVALPLGLLVKGAAGLLPAGGSDGLWGHPFSAEELDEADALSEYSCLYDDGEEDMLLGEGMDADELKALLGGGGSDDSDEEKGSDDEDDEEAEAEAEAETGKGSKGKKAGGEKAAAAGSDGDDGEEDEEGSGDEESASRAAIPQLDDRLRLAKQLGLVPEELVFKVPAGGQLPAQLLELLRLLLLPEPALESLTDALGPWLTQQADDEGGELDPEQPWSKEAEQAFRAALQQVAQQAQQQQEQPAKRRKVAEGEADAAAAPKVADVLLAVAGTMCRRYPASLAADEELEGRLGQLPARQQAALVARLQEKRAWEQLVAEVRQQQGDALAAVALDVEVMVEGAKQILIKLREQDSDGEEGSDEDEDEEGSQEEEAAAEEKQQTKGSKGSKGDDCCTDSGCTRKQGKKHKHK
jgi:hypothetical protein